MSATFAVTVQPASSMRGRVRPPGDKSISHRYAMLASIADGPSVIHGYSTGADCRSTLSCLRALGLPARYVSGYLLTDPPPGQPRLIGADASHAWLSVHCPWHGWIDLDPTNALLPDARHITLAWGRDYGDVSPLRGVVLGGAEHTLTVGVSVVPTESVASTQA